MYPLAKNFVICIHTTFSLVYRNFLVFVMLYAQVNALTGSRFLRNRISWNPQSGELEGAPPPDPPSYGATKIPLPDKHHMVTKHTMRDFIGLENADLEARKAMMNFSYLSAIGNMDEAFKAIKLIKRLVILKSGSVFSWVYWLVLVGRRG